MQQPDHPNEPLSIVEDLDPEPPSGSHLAQRLEVLAGIILLVGVLAFVGWQWWHTQVQTSSYSAGQAALASNDWDAALANFAQAGDYKDAPQLAQRAQVQVAARDKLYTSAEQHIASSEWLPALIDVRAAAEIQSGYKKLATWEKQALAGVYTDALSGTVAMRPYADPPGLYMRGANSWIYLQGSDRESTLEQTPHNGRLVFDAEDVIGNPGTRHLESALLVGDRFEYTPLSFDWISASGPEGVWSTLYSYVGGIEDTGPANEPVIRNPFQDYSEGAIVAYEPFSTTLTYTIAPPPSFTDSTGNDLVVAVGPQAHYLTASYTGAISSSVSSSTVVTLSLGTVNSNITYPLYTYTGGGIQSAQFSPDGHYALITTFRIASRNTEEQSLVLIDLESLRSPYTIRKVMLTNQLADFFVYPLQSVFVQSGAYAGDIVLAQPQADHTDILLFDPTKVSSPEASGAPIAQATVPGARDDIWFVSKQNAGGLLIVGQDGLASARQADLTLVAVTIPVVGPASVQTIATENANYLDAFQTSRNRIVWSYSLDEKQNDSAVAVSSVPITPTTGIQPTQIYSARSTLEQAPGSTGPSLSLGDNLLAYVTNRYLHVRTYDGKLDLNLEPDVSVLWNKGSFDYDRDMLR